MTSRPRMSGNIKAKLSLDRASFARLKSELKALEKAARKEVIEKALRAGGGVIHSAAESRAPGSLAFEIVGGRTLRKRVDPRFAAVIKANAKVAAIGPDEKHWYFRFWEFGAKPHDIDPRRVKALLIKSIGETAFMAHARQTGGVPKRPFLRPAVDEQGTAAIAAMGDVLASEIRKAAKS